ncbi:MAG: HAMP domain-containing histidine kinase [Lachnospiraceae bacterium]|jgi:signal transduction histidine kinase|nr:HAMP domain-containing histidine kinase [Lachnospiraceae bacterium]
MNQTKKEIARLSQDIRKIIDGNKIDLRDNKEGVLSILKNDIHTLASMLTEQTENSQKEKELLRDTLADISHQIKTPLTSMSIMVDLLSDSLTDPAITPQKQAEFLENIKISLARTQWLVTALLKLQKLESGVITFSKEKTSSRSIVELALQPLQILLDVKNQTVESDGDIPLFCDKHWTSEALTNIIKNASEYSPTDGKIRITVGENPICTWLSITDAGQGLTKAQIATLFRRFEGSRSKYGVGIGLPLALAIMREQNGDIEVENAEDGGAKFTLKFYKAT